VRFAELLNVTADLREDPPDVEQLDGLRTWADLAGVLLIGGE
jgi:hypothetical protein